jgi:hypothetical protein
VRVHHVPPISVSLSQFEPVIAAAALVTRAAEDIGDAQSASEGE